MRWLLALVLFIVAAGPVRAGLPPDAAFTDLAGNGRTLSDFRGQVVLVNFWATWCVPCVAEMPALDALQGAMEGIRVLPLAQDRDPALVVSFFRRHRLPHLQSFLDAKGRAGRSAGIKGLPTSILLDRTGREVARWEGAVDWRADEIRRLIQRVVESP